MKYAIHPLIYPNIVEEREYQRKIVEAAAEKNTLVVLPTALGKTVISALIAAKVLYSYRDKRVLVMAPSKPLVLQHRNTFQKIIRLPPESFVLLTGKTPSDIRETIWGSSSRIVFATPQVVRNDILRKGLNLQDFGMLVFDECHRAVKEYAYTEVAKLYVRQSEYPLIIGMTASPGSDSDRIKTVCESLFIEHVEYRSDDNTDVKPYIHPIKVEWIKVDLPQQYETLSDTLKSMLDNRVRWLRSQGFLKDNFKWVSRRQVIDLGTELRYNAELSIEEEKGLLYKAIAEQSSALTLFHMQELLETQGIYTLRAFMKRIENDGKRSHTTLMMEESYERLLEQIKEYSLLEHPKIDRLRQVVGDQLKVNSSARILVFTQYRDTATHLVEALSRIDGVKAERFVGQATKLGDLGLTQEKQASLIQDLRTGQLNVLVATSIAEEGLDIPEVDLVVFYEPIPSEIRYIKRRGRTGRKTAGEAIILVTNETSDMTYLIASSRRVEKMNSIASKLNSLLTPILRVKPKPPAKPMMPQELQKIQSLITPSEKPLRAASETERLRDLSRRVANAEKAAYFKILEKGEIGISNIELIHEMEDEGYIANIVKAALSRLLKAKHVGNIAGKSIIQSRNIPSASLRDIRVEKVMTGLAVVWVDDKWRARLSAEDYDGPRDLVKKHARFKALSELYHDSGTLCVRVRQVVQTMR
jgi:Fanconi anemia group M protein